MDEFAASLSQFNQVILLDIYPARELPIEGVTSSALMEKMNTSCDLLPKSEVTNWAATNQPEVLITIGAGDIDTLVSPLKEWVCQ
jgi:UDP-N-acetylmuramate--alanine ligase